MKSRLLGITVLALVLILILQGVSFAITPRPGEPTPTPTPKPPEADCSPGFWKNHTELWYDDPQWADPAWMLAALEAKGNDKVHRPYRFVVADMLNAEYPDAPCDD